LLGERKRTVLLGLAFLFFLLLSSIENTLFFNIVGNIFQNALLAVAVFFMHNVLVVSLILLGMTFYVNLVVSNFFRREKYGYIVLEHPRTFALIFTVIVVLLSILRGGSLLGGISFEELPLILLISAPVGIVEGYGIYITIEKTLRREISTRDLIYIYGIFLLAAIMEVGFINVLTWILTG
jgi:hypothetical protein